MGGSEKRNEGNKNNLLFALITFILFMCFLLFIQHTYYTFLNKNNPAFLDTVLPHIIIILASHFKNEKNKGKKIMLISDLLLYYYV